MLEDKEVRDWMDRREAVQQQFLADQAELNRRHHSRLAWLSTASALIAGLSALVALGSLGLVVISGIPRAASDPQVMSSVQGVSPPTVVSPVPAPVLPVMVPVQSKLPDGKTVTKYVQMDVGQAPSGTPLSSPQRPVLPEPESDDAATPHPWGASGTKAPVQLPTPFSPTTAVSPSTEDKDR